MNIPFVDLKSQYLSIKPEIDQSIQEVIDQTAFIGGSYVKTFEANFAKLIGMKHCIGVANGTDAIYIVLKMLGIGAGDEVITVANSWISTSETISQTGATPVFVDVDEYFTIDVSKIEKHINSRTKAIIPVHLYGQPADIEAIMKIANKHNLPVIEDCAQSHFTEINGKYVGTFGVASTFSYYPGKNLGAYGDAGSIVTNNDELAEKCRMYANHGALKKHHHLMEGINSRLDSLQASILNTKLKYILQWTASRINNAELYSSQLAGITEIEIPRVRSNAKHTFHLYVIKAGNREDLKQHLEQNGIETSIHYPTTLPLLPCYSYLNKTSADFPRAYHNQQRILSLPMYPELSADQIAYVCKTIKAFYEKR